MDFMEWWKAVNDLLRKRGFGEIRWGDARDYHHNENLTVDEAVERETQRQTSNYTKANNFCL
jgi:hypothetical protein